MSDVVQAIDMAGRWTAVCIAIPFAWKIIRMLIAAQMSKSISTKVQELADSVTSLKGNKPE